MPEGPAGATRPVEAEAVKIAETAEKSSSTEAVKIAETAEKSSSTEAVNIAKTVEQTAAAETVKVVESADKPAHNEPVQAVLEKPISTPQTSVQHDTSEDQSQDHSNDLSQDQSSSAGDSSAVEKPPAGHTELSFSSLKESSAKIFSASPEDRAKLTGPVFNWMVNNLGDLQECTAWVQNHCEGEFNMASYDHIRSDDKLVGFVILQKNQTRSQERRFVFLLNPDGEIVSMRAGREDIVTVSAADFETVPNSADQRLSNTTAR